MIYIRQQDPASEIENKFESCVLHALFAVFQHMSTGQHAAPRPVSISTRCVARELRGRSGQSDRSPSALAAPGIYDTVGDNFPIICTDCEKTQAHTF